MVYRLPFTLHFMPDPDPRNGNTILTLTALEAGGGVQALRRSRREWPYDIAFADQRCTSYLPEHVQAMEALPPDAIFRYPDGSAQFQAHRFCDPTTPAYSALLEHMVWGERRSPDPFIDGLRQFHCSADVNARIYGDSQMMLNARSEPTCDPENVGVCVAFQRNAPTAAAIATLAETLGTWRQSAARVAALPTCRVDILDQQLRIWRSLVHFRVALRDADRNVLHWLLICLLNQSLGGGRPVAIAGLQYNVDVRTTLQWCKAPGPEARFDLAAMRFEDGFPLPKRGRASTVPASASGPVEVPYSELANLGIPVMVTAAHDPQSARLTIHFEEWLTADAKKHLQGLLQSWEKISDYHGFKEGAIRYCGALRFDRKGCQASAELDLGESTEVDSASPDKNSEEL